MCKSEIAQKAISLHDLAGAGAKSAKNGTRFRLRLPRSAIALFLRTDQQGKLNGRNGAHEDLLNVDNRYRLDWRCEGGY